MFVVCKALNNVVEGSLTTEAIVSVRLELVPKGVRLIEATIISIDFITGEVKTDVGTFKADFLVVALGAGKRREDIY